MNNETITQLKEVFAPIAEKIGQGAEFGWEVVVRQQYVEAITDLVAIVVGIILAYIAYKVSKSIDDWDDSKNIAKGILFIVCALTSFSMFAGGTCDFLSEGIGQLINPEYYAIQFFMGLVK